MSSPGGSHNCRNCGLLEVMDLGDRVAARCSAGMWDQAGVETWYSWSQVIRSRNRRVIEIGRSCAQYGPRRSHEDDHR